MIFPGSGATLSIIAAVASQNVIRTAGRRRRRLPGGADGGWLFPLVGVLAVSALGIGLGCFLAWVVSR